MSNIRVFWKITLLFRVLMGTLLTVLKWWNPEFLSRKCLKWLLFFTVIFSTNSLIESELIISLSNSNCIEGFRKGIYGWLKASIAFAVDLISLTNPSLVPLTAFAIGSKGSFVSYW